MRGLARLRAPPSGTGHPVSAGGGFGQLGAAYLVATVLVMVLAQLLGTSPWFAVNAVMPDLQREFGWSTAALGTLSSGIQIGFIVGTLVVPFLFVAVWAADCAERVLPLFDAEAPDDDRARDAIAESDVVIGYVTYIKLVADLIEGKEIIRKSMTEELDRAVSALEARCAGGGGGVGQGAGGGAADVLVCPLHGALQVAGPGCGGQCLERLHSHARGHLAGLGTTHTVGHDEQVRAGVARVLVVGAHLADVRDGSTPVSTGHHLPPKFEAGRTDLHRCVQRDLRGNDHADRVQVRAVRRV